MYIVQCTVRCTVYTIDTLSINLINSNIGIIKSIFLNHHLVLYILLVIDIISSFLDLKMTLEKSEAHQRSDTKQCFFCRLFSN